MAFAWDFGDGVLKYFQFAALPFGLSSAPYLFTKLLKPVVIIPIVIFLDDGLGGDANKIQAKISCLTVNADLLKFGFVVNEDKFQQQHLFIPKKKDKIKVALRTSSEYSWLGTAVLDSN